MEIIKQLLNDIVAIELLENDLVAKKELQDKQLNGMMPKDVSAVKYDVEAVQGGFKQSEENAILEFAKVNDDIYNIKQLLKILRKKVDCNKKSIYKLLNDEESRIFNLKFIDGMTASDISYTIHRSERDVWRKIKRIKEKIEIIETQINNITCHNFVIE